MAITVPLNLATAAVRLIKADPYFESLVFESFIGSDYDDGASPQDRLAAAWLFQGLNEEGRPFRDPEGSSRAAVVVSQRSEWSAPNQHNTLGFPRLQILVYSDSTRLEDGSAPVLDALDRGEVIMRFMHRLFHRPQNDVHYWDTLPIVSSLGGSLLDVRDVPGTQGATVRLERTYNVEFG